MRSSVVVVSLALAGGCAGGVDARSATKRDVVEARASAAAPASSELLEPPVVPPPLRLVRAALDGRVDNDGQWVSFAWRRLSFRAPSDWLVQPNAQGNLLLPSASKQPFMAALFVDQAEPDALVALERTLPISHCRWLPDETAIVGRDSLEAEVVDGTCRRDDEIVSIARVRYAVSGVAFFIWSTKADPAPLWQIARAVGNAAPQRLAPCCTALRQNAKSAPPAQIAQYQQAADICTLDMVGANPETMAKVRTALLGASLPAACR